MLKIENLHAEVDGEAILKGICFELNPQRNPCDREAERVGQMDIGLMSAFHPLIASPRSTELSRKRMVGRRPVANLTPDNPEAAEAALAEPAGMCKLAS